MKNYHHLTQQQRSTFEIMDDVTTSSLIWSPCGQSVNLRVNISTIASTNSSMKQTLSVIETGIIDHIQWKSCY